MDLKPERKADLFAVGMVAGGLPCSLFILIFLEMTSAREAGQPYSGDALGLMMMSLLAYALALVSCGAGVLHFGLSLFKNEGRPRTWQWLALIYALTQVVVPVAYFSIW